MGSGRNADYIHFVLWDILTYGIKVTFDDLTGLQDELRSGMTAYVDFGK